MSEIILETTGLTRVFGGGRTFFGRRRREVHAVQGIDLDLHRGETLGVVGESGCGKSTLARMLVGLDAPTGGTIRLKGEDVTALAKSSPRALARSIQYVFQDPVSSLNPRKTIRRILEAPMKHLLGLDAARRRRRLEELMDAVSLRHEFLERYPHEFSGGQAQRIGIARALAAEPEILVLDEPVSALDVSVQAQVLNLLDDLKARFGLTYVFISHDLSVVESVSDRVAVMYFGRVVEEATGAELFANPRHPYTRLLLASAPVPGKKGLASEEGLAELPDPYNPPPGCAFAPRCQFADKDCREGRPLLEDAAGDRRAACFHPQDRLETTA